MHRPTFRDVLEAHKTIAPYVEHTPLVHYSALSQFLGAEVRLKHENHHPIGAFKMRGGINVVAHLEDEERRRGIITASTGNHGQSIAYAGRLFGVKVIICVPEGANPLKVQAMRNLGAEVLFHGRHFDEAREYCERLAQEEGYRYIHAVNEPLIIAGAATYTLEIIEDWPEVEAVFVPFGGGGGATGACIVAKAIDPSIQVIAVQSAQASAGYLSWKNRRIVEAPMETFAEGLATATGYELTQSILWELLDDFVLVEDREIAWAIGLLVEKAHTLAEGAGAAALAGVVKVKDKLKGKKVAVVVSGGNITLERLREALEVYQEG